MSTFVEVFNAPLGVGVFTVGVPFMITAERLTLDFEVVVTGAGTRVQWFPEFTSGNPNPAAVPPAEAFIGYFREVAEETLPGGVVNMALTLREFQLNGGAALGVGTHRFDAQLVRAHQFCRIQMTLAAGAASVIVRAPFGVLIRT